MKASASAGSASPTPVPTTSQERTAAAKRAEQRLAEQDRRRREAVSFLKINLIKISSYASVI